MVGTGRKPKTEQQFVVAEVDEAPKKKCVRDKESAASVFVLFRVFSRFFFPSLFFLLIFSFK